MLLREAYETTYGIYDHNNPPQGGNPLDLVLHRHKEDCDTYGLMDRTIREYKLKDVYKRFGLNLVEFLNLPPVIAQKVLDISVEEALVEGKTYTDIKDELGIK